MEFFDWMAVPQTVLQYIGLGYSTLEELIDIQLLTLWIMLGVAGGLYIFGLVMGGIGLYTMAKKAGIKYPWLGFLPFGNTFLAGKLAGETTVFGQKMKRVGLYAMIAEIVFVALNIMILVVNFALVDPLYYSEVLDADGVLMGYQLDIARVPQQIRIFSAVVEPLSLVADLVLIFFFCVMFYAFFRKYYARSPFLMTFLCAVLPVRGFVLFAVRNNKPMAYTARPTPMYGPMYGGNTSTTPPPAPPEEPFPDFTSPSGGQKDSGTDGGAPGASSSDSPFEDF